MDKRLLHAAERGDVEAQFNLGIVYENGFAESRYCVDGDRAESIRWLTAAAEQGLARAQIKLAEIYADDPDAPENAIKACGWFLLGVASLQGARLHRAQSTYQRISRRFTPAQTAQVRRFAQNWKPKTPSGALLSDQHATADRRHA
jgi:TPR repeat protein